MATCSKCGGLIPAGTSGCPFCGAGCNTGQQYAGRVKVGPVRPGGWDGIAQPPRHNPADDDYTAAVGFGMLVLGFAAAAFWIMFAVLLGITAWQLFGTALRVKTNEWESVSVFQILSGAKTLPADELVNTVLWYGYFIVFALTALLAVIILIGNIRIFIYRISSWTSQWRRLALCFMLLLFARIAMAVIVFALCDHSIIVIPAGNFFSLFAMFICTVICGKMLRNYQYT